MQDRVVAVEVRTHATGPQGDRVGIGAAALEQDRSSQTTLDRIGSTSDVAAELLEFLERAPAVWISHHVGPVHKLLRGVGSRRSRHVILDTAELTRVLFPALVWTDLDSLAERLSLPRPDGQRPVDACVTTLHLWRRLADRAAALPPAVLAQIGRLLGTTRQHPLRDFFRWAQSQAGEPLTGTELEDLFVEEKPPRARRKIPDPMDCKLLDVDKVAGAFGPEGAFAHAVEGYEHRAQQVEMARAVTEALNGSMHLLVEAGTGIGKSLAYLLPAVLWARTNKTPVVVSTNTKNLQGQLFGKDLPLLRQAVKGKFKAALIKGRRNYLCLRKLGYMLDHAALELDRSELARMAGVLVWAAQTRTGDLAESGLGEGRESWGLANKVSSLRDECPGPACRFRSRCFLYRARRRSLAADVVVANHSVVFAEMGMESPVLPPYDHVVFDEAHNLENAATLHFSVEVSLPRIRSVLNRLWRPSRRKTGAGLVPAIVHALRAVAAPDVHAQAAQRAEAVVTAVGTVEPATHAFFEALAALLGPHTRDQTRRIRPEHRNENQWAPIRATQTVVLGALQRVSRSTQSLADVLRRLPEVAAGKLAELIGDLDAVIVWLAELERDIGFVLATDDEGYVYWVESAHPRQGGVRAWAAPIDVGQKLADELYTQKETVVFSSATLSVRGTTDFLKQRLGVDRVDAERLVEMDAGTPFDFPSQCRVLVPTFLPEPGDGQRDYATELGLLLADVFRRTQGRGMALFTSHQMLRRSTDVLTGELAGDAIRVLAQGVSGSRESTTEAFKRDLRSVLMGTHSFWEGVDVMGESLSCLVLARLPFPVFTDPIVEARCEQVEAAGQSAFLGYSVPSAVIRFRQGFGRLIRHRTDRGVVIVADRRIVAKRYGAWFRESIPAEVHACPDREPFLDTIGRFLANR